MPYATNAGVRIYYEREGNGLPIVLHQSFSLSHQDWRDWGYADILKGGYELILMDPRGHGASDKPHDPAAYTVERRVADVIAVMDDADIARAIFWGYAMGGLLGYAAATIAPQRFRAVIVGSSNPYAGEPEALRHFADAILREGLLDYMAAWERAGMVIGPGLRQRLLANDIEALAAVAIAHGEHPSFAERLGEVAVPMLVYVGDGDQPNHDLTQRAIAGNPQVTFVSLPGCNHFTTWPAAAPHVLAFLAELGES